ncbi:MAG: hypothetical protein Q9178_006274 [Gyalolechia marmorata]
MKILTFARKKLDLLPIEVWDSPGHLEHSLEREAIARAAMCLLQSLREGERHHLFLMDEWGYFSDGPGFYVPGAALIKLIPLFAASWANVIILSGVRTRK